jgi:hypothetical protein
MADWDDKHWWKHWWRQTENAVVPWCLATMAVLAAIAYGAAAALRWLVLNYHRIPTNSTGPNWAEIVYTALTGVLVLIAFLALGSVREARRARIGLQMTELSRRWDEETRLKCAGRFTSTREAVYRDDWFGAQRLLAEPGGPFVVGSHPPPRGRIDSWNA